MTYTHTSTFVTCPACGHRLTEMNGYGTPTKAYQHTMGYRCLEDDGGCGTRYDMAGRPL